MKRILRQIFERAARGQALLCVSSSPIAPAWQAHWGAPDAMIVYRHIIGRTPDDYVGFFEAISTVTSKSKEIAPSAG